MTNAAILVILMSPFICFAVLVAMAVRQKKKPPVKEPEPNHYDIRLERDGCLWIFDMTNQRKRQLSEREADLYVFEGKFPKF